METMNLSFSLTSNRKNYQSFVTFVDFLDMRICRRISRVTTSTTRKQDSMGGTKLAQGVQTKQPVRDGAVKELHGKFNSESIQLHRNVEPMDQLHRKGEKLNNHTAYDNTEQNQLSQPNRTDKCDVTIDNTAAIQQLVEEGVKNSNVVAPTDTVQDQHQHQEKQLDNDSRTGQHHVDSIREKHTGSNREVYISGLAEEIIRKAAEDIMEQVADDIIEDETVKTRQEGPHNGDTPTSSKTAEMEISLLWGDRVEIE